jgi:hypothetical protein
MLCSEFGKIKFPAFSGLRCLMMPYVQGDPGSVLEQYLPYREIISSVFFRKGDVGFLTIDESVAKAGTPHRGARAKFGRALHTEAGLLPDGVCAWGGPTPVWGGTVPKPKPKPEPKPNYVTLDRDTEVLLANNIDNSCAIWDTEHPNTSPDGDIGDQADKYPYYKATMMKSEEVHKIGIFTPHESLPVLADVQRQFLRIVSKGVYGREPYFTENPLFYSKHLHMGGAI